MLKFVAKLFAACLPAVAVGLVILFVIHGDTPPKHLPAITPGIELPGNMPPIVRLHDKKTGRFFCSGTVVAANYIITAAHCVDERSYHKASIEVRGIDGKPTSVFATPVYHEGRSDLALLNGDFSGFDPLPFSDDPTSVIGVMLMQDRPLISCGFPEGGNLWCVQLQNRVQIEFGFAAEAELYPGMSGGPVIDYLTGTVIGVNTAVLERGVYLSPLIELLTRAGLKEIGE